MIDIHKSCSCFGHSEIEITDELKYNLRSIIEKLITKENVKYFYFGGFGDFDDLCWQIVTELKKIYSNIYRIFVWQIQGINDCQKGHIGLKMKIMRKLHIYL